MPFANLPPELLALIIKAVPAQADLISLSLTCRRLNAISERLLYRNVNLTTVAQAYRFRQAVSREDRTLHVRDFKLDIYGSIALNGFEGCEGYPAGSFDSDFLAMFPNLESLFVYAPPFNRHLVSEEMVKVREGGALAKLKSCSLAFKACEWPEEDSQQLWDLKPFEDMLLLPSIENLTLMCATVDKPFEQDVPPTNLTSLALLSCNLSHSWLRAFLQLPKALADVKIEISLVESEAALTSLLNESNQCLEPSKGTIRNLTFINCLPVRFPGGYDHLLSHFRGVKDLTVSASELFGPLTSSSIPWTVARLPMLLPASLELLSLQVFPLDIHGDTSGTSQGIFRLLFILLLPENKRHVPALKKIVLHIAARRPMIPDELIERAADAGVECRLATMEERMKMRKSLAMLMA